MRFVSTYTVISPALLRRFLEIISSGYSFFVIPFSFTNLQVFPNEYLISGNPEPSCCLETPYPKGTIESLESLTHIQKTEKSKKKQFSYMTIESCRLSSLVG